MQPPDNRSGRGYAWNMGWGHADLGKHRAVAVDGAGIKEADAGGQGGFAARGFP